MDDYVKVFDIINDKKYNEYTKKISYGSKLNFVNKNILIGKISWKDKTLDICFTPEDLSNEGINTDSLLFMEGVKGYLDIDYTSVTTKSIDAVDYFHFHVVDFNNKFGPLKESKLKYVLFAIAIFALWYIIR